MYDAYKPTYILTWNPKVFDFPDYSDICKEVKEKGYACTNWSIRNKQITNGDRFVLMRLGSKADNGIVAAGHFVSDPIMDEREQIFIDIQITYMWDLSEPYIRVDELTEKFPEQLFTPQSSGISIKSYILPDLWLIIKERQAQIDIRRHEMLPELPNGTICTVRIDNAPIPKGTIVKIIERSKVDGEYRVENIESHSHYWLKRSELKIKEDLNG